MSMSTNSTVVPASSLWFKEKWALAASIGALLNPIELLEMLQREKLKLQHFPFIGPAFDKSGESEFLPTVQFLICFLLFLVTKVKLNLNFHENRFENFLVRHIHAIPRAVCVTSKKLFIRKVFKTFIFQQKMELLFELFLRSAE